MKKQKLRFDLFFKPDLAKIVILIILFSLLLLIFLPIFLNFETPINDDWLFYLSVILNLPVLAVSFPTESALVLIIAGLLWNYTLSCLIVVIFKELKKKFC
jgi:hypothetical protein